MSQFVFLQREWPAVSDAASKAEAAVHTDRRKQPMRVPEWAERCRLEAAQPTSDFDQAVAEVKRLDAGTAPKPSREAKNKTAKKAAPKRKPKGGGDA